MDWWEQLDESAMLELIIYGIRETMDYYYKYLPCMPAVEEASLKDPDNRKRAVKAVLLSWSVPAEETGNIAQTYDDVFFIKRRIISLLNSFWEAGLKKQWRGMRENLSGWIRQHKSLLTKAYCTNREAIFEITGLYPDTSELEKINRAEFLTFIPAANMERLLSFTQFDQHVYLMFAPQAEAEEKKEKLADHNAAFEGLGDVTRLQILDLLAENKEMFAQQIVQQLNLKQSTVSRHLNQLHQSNLVMIHQVGNTKYFSVNREEINKVAASLSLFLKM
ncbi:helix-turn-helix transcriptional regulator [Oceanobacillus sp. CFH 90083]|uniref:ArsR/SmtB family transcription factor n=1 Tax=Oceanobacillus sp. CFH 90083 TaxID=2592336 RepID=UPI00128BBBC7|nr:metalloregulator ArsR/SmtB family transcription factor [Oceanobacillus sp. CFH 90083]